MNPRPQRQRPGSTSPVGRPPLQPEPEQIRVGDQIATDTTPPPPAHSQTPELPDSRSTGVPKFRTFVRKESRVRGDQADALLRLRRRLGRNRTDHSERITDNTLIRVAIDLLLAHEDRLHGDTETELRNSVTPRVPE